MSVDHIKAIFILKQSSSAALLCSKRLFSVDSVCARAAPKTLTASLLDFSRKQMHLQLQGRPRVFLGAAL